MSSDSCPDSEYDQALSTFQALIYGIDFLWLMLLVIILPRPTHPGTRSSWLRDGCHAVTPCLDQCRLLLSRDDSVSMEALRSLGTVVSCGFIGFALLLQTLPLASLIAAVSLHFPRSNMCSCMLSINGIPFGSCVGFGIFVAVICSLAAAAFAFKIMKVMMKAVNGQASYSPAGTISGEMI